MQDTSETRVQSLSQEDRLEEETATHSNIIAWRIPWTEKPGGPQSGWSQRVGPDWNDWARMQASSLHIKKCNIARIWGSLLVFLSKRVSHSWGNRYLLTSQL